jgi:hypothetical protein
MVKNRSEIPVTYLNKGQAYDLSVVDTSPPIGNYELFDIEHLSAFPAKSENCE